MNFKSSITLVLLGTLLLRGSLSAADISDVRGIKEACVAGSILDASHISNKVVILLSDGGSGCLYQVNGTPYLYTREGSLELSASQASALSAREVSRKDVLRISDGSRHLPNGCLVFARCAYAASCADSHIVWSGIITARIVNVNNFGDDQTGFQMTGHAVLILENENKEVFFQENGEEPHELEQMTALARRGDTSWGDPSTLIFCVHHLQAFATFSAEHGHSR